MIYQASWPLRRNSSRSRLRLTYCARQPRPKWSSSCPAVARATGYILAIGTCQRGRSGGPEMNRPQRSLCPTGLVIALEARSLHTQDYLRKFRPTHGPGTALLAMDHPRQRGRFYKNRKCLSYGTRGKMRKTRNSSPQMTQSSPPTTVYLHRQPEAGDTNVTG